LAFAVEQSRVIVTQDTDFLRLRHSHTLPGIAFFPAGDRTIGQNRRAPVTYLGDSRTGGDGRPG
jgi:hypothetical protein